MKYEIYFLKFVRGMQIFIFLDIFCKKNIIKKVKINKSIKHKINK